MQTWIDPDAFEKIRKGTITEKGKERPLKKRDANFLGTSYVFLRYDDKVPGRIWVRHHWWVEDHDESDWAVWIAANPVAPAAAAP